MDDRFGDLLCRLDSKLRDFPPDAMCADCEIGVPLVLLDRAGEVLCQGCDLERRGLSRYEEHHLGGQTSPAVIPLPANLHEVLTPLQDLTWRGVFAPGSGWAILFDILALIHIGPAFLDVAGTIHSQWEPE